MRRLVVALALVAGMGLAVAPASAGPVTWTKDEAAKVGDKIDRTVRRPDVKLDAAGNIVTTRRYDKFFFGTTGPRARAGRACGVLAPVAMRTHRTRGDWALSVATLGIWTPKHVDVTCR